MRRDLTTWALVAALVFGPAMWSLVQPVTTYAVAVQSAADVPTLTAHERDRLHLAEMAIENAALRLQLVQVQLRDAQEALRREVAALARDGYRLDRTAAGEWTYVETGGER